MDYHVVEARYVRDHVVWLRFKTARRVRWVSHLSWKGPSSNRFATRSFSSSSEWMRSSTRSHGPTGPTLPRSAYIVLPQSKQTLEPIAQTAREYGGEDPLKPKATREIQLTRDPILEA